MRRNLAENDLVLVVDKNISRGGWLLARVTKVLYNTQKSVNLNTNLLNTFQQEFAHKQQLRNEL